MAEKLETAFVREHPRAVLITRRRDGGIQASPIRILLDDEERIVATTREATAKARNLARDPSCALCVISSEWQGAWLTIEATTEIVHLPEALEALRSFYLARDGSVADPKEFERIMNEEGRVLLRFTVTRSGGTAKAV